MTDLTQTELTRLASVLGIEREVYREFYSDISCSIYTPEWTINLPSPLSDSPRACLWEPFLMRALGWPSWCIYIDHECRKEYKVNDRAGARWEPTPTAALFRAFEAARPDWRNQ